MTEEFKTIEPLATVARCGAYTHIVAEASDAKIRIELIDGEIHVKVGAVKYSLVLEEGLNNFRKACVFRSFAQEMAEGATLKITEDKFEFSTDFEMTVKQKDQE